MCIWKKSRIYFENKKILEVTEDIVSSLRINLEKTTGK